MAMLAQQMQLANAMMPGAQLQPVVSIVLLFFISVPGYDSYCLSYGKKIALRKLQLQSEIVHHR